MVLVARQGSRREDIEAETFVGGRRPAMSDRNLLLVAYADGELAPEEAQKAETLIAGDPQARAMVDMFRETAALLSAACGEEFYERGAAFSSAARSRQRYGWALAASLATAIAGFGGGTMWAGGPSSERTELLEDVVGYHAVYSRETRHLVEVP